MRSITLGVLGALLGVLLSSCTAAVEAVPTPTPVESGSATVTSAPVSTPMPDAGGEDDAELAFAESGQRFGEVLAFGMAIADVDLDGDEDLFLANYIGPSQLWLNDGDGRFSRSSQRFGSADAARGHGVAIADLNGDSYPDVFLANHQAASRVFFGDGAGRFAASEQEIVSRDPTTVVLADADGDGDVDALLIYARQANELWVNDGDGRFTQSDDDFSGGGTSISMLAEDLNGDGLVDLVYCYIDRPGSVWINDGQGGFADTGQSIYGCGEVESGDVDGDGDPDLVVSVIDDGARVWLNQDSSGTFAAAGDGFAPGVWKFKLLDADLDGDLDMVVSNILEEETRLWLNDGSGVFAASDQRLDDNWASAIAVGRLDADDDVDVVLCRDGDPGSCMVHLNE